MAEISEILNRVRELSVQAANDTNALVDRTVIQSEVDELIKEISRISDDTEFNTIPILNGRYNNEDVIPGQELDRYVQSITTSGGVNDKYEYIDNSAVPPTTKQYASAIIDFSNLTSLDKIEKIADKGANYTCCTCNKAYSIKFVNGDADISRLDAINPVMEVI